MSRTYKDRPLWLRTFYRNRNDLYKNRTVIFHDHFTHKYSECGFGGLTFARMSAAGSIPDPIQHKKKCRKLSWEYYFCSEESPEVMDLYKNNPSTKIKCWNALETGYLGKVLISPCLGHRITHHEDLDCSCDRWEEVKEPGCSKYTLPIPRSSKDFIRHAYHKPERQRARITLDKIADEYNTFQDLDEITDDYYSHQARNSAEDHFFWWY